MATHVWLDIGAGDIVHALGALGYDFGTETRREAFQRGMAAADRDGANPSDPAAARSPVAAMVDYLARHPHEMPRLLWTVSVDLTPVYALLAAGPFACDVHEALWQLLEAQTRPADDPGYVERIGVSGR